MILKLTAEKRNSRRFSLSMETLPKAQTFIVVFRASICGRQCQIGAVLFRWHPLAQHYPTKEPEQRGVEIQLGGLCFLPL